MQKLTCADVKQFQFEGFLEMLNQEVIPKQTTCGLARDITGTPRLWFRLSFGCLESISVSPFTKSENKVQVTTVMMGQTLSLWLLTVLEEKFHHCLHLAWVLSWLDSSPSYSSSSISHSMISRFPIKKKAFTSTSWMVPLLDTSPFPPHHPVPT